MLKLKILIFLRNLIRARVTCSGMVTRDSGEGEDRVSTRTRGNNPDREINRRFGQIREEPSKPFVIYGKRMIVYVTLIKPTRFDSIRSRRNLPYNTSVEHLLYEC